MINHQTMRKAKYAQTYCTYDHPCPFFRSWETSLRNEGMMIVNDNEKLGRKMFPLSSEFFMLSMQNKIIIYQKLIYAKHKKY